MTDSPLDAARRHVEAAVDFLKLDATGAAALREAHEVALRTTATGGIAYTDKEGAVVPSLDTAGWLRRTETERPELVGKAAPPRSIQPAPATAPTASFSELMLAARNGDAAARAVLDDRLRVQTGAPAPVETMTATMKRAKAGDVAAMNTLKSWKIK